jgi:hypothetical protein
MVTLTQGIGKPTVSDQTSHAFEIILPSIKRIASYAFRHVRRWQRAELVADVVAAAYTAFVRLVERGLECLIYPSALAKYAIRRVRIGRQVGQKQNINDVLSTYAQRRRGFSVEQLPLAIANRDWHELTADRRADPSEVAALRLDLQEWLCRLTHMKRKVALRMAIGDSNAEIARLLGLSSGRISQLRRELKVSWDTFQSALAAG